MSYLHTLLKLSESQSISQKINSIQGAIEYLEQIHSQTMGDVSSQTWSSIVAVFSVMGCAACLPSLPPILGFGLVGGAVASTIASVATAAQAYPETKMKDEKVALILGVLRSNTPKQWAHVWEESPDTTAFLMGIERAAANGYIDSVGYFQYYGANTRHPFDVAREWAIAASEELPKLSPSSQVGQKTKLIAIETDAEVIEEKPVFHSPEPEQPGIEILDSLVGTRRFTLPPFDRDRIINESKGLMIIGDMGAAKTCVAQHIANGFEGHGIIIFDPHGMTDWGNAYVITKMGAIYEQMRILLDLLENGDTTPLLIICDEWLEIRGDRRNKKGSDYAGLAEDFIRLFSTKPRKFNKLAGFVLHSPNVEAAGVDSFLRENYLKIYLGRLAKKTFPDIQDCAYPCVLEDEQQEHPTHGHHTEFKPKGKAPRKLEPLQSAPINIPLAYMKGSEVEVCDRGWADGQLRLQVENIRQRLELLLDSSALEPNPEPNSSIAQNPEPLNQAPEPLNQPTDEGCTDLEDGSQFSSEDGSERFTPLKLTKEQVLALIENLNSELNQTQIIERLWQVKKGGSAAWKEAREQFKQLTGE